MTTHPINTHYSAEAAFKNAIECELFTEAGADAFMYMGSYTQGERRLDYFKNAITRKYETVSNRSAAHVQS